MFDLIVPVFNSLHHARSCIKSILNAEATSGYRLHIVDDGSESFVSHALDDLRQAAPEKVSIITNPKNLGYLASANRAAGSGTGRYLVFVNSDTVVPPDFITRLTATFEHDDRVGVVNAVSNWANWTRICWAIPPGHNVYTLNERLKERCTDPIRDIYNASGFFFATPRKVFELLGGFDPIYGAGYWEESDYCMKALRKGYRVVVDESLFVYHHGWGSFQEAGRNANMSKNKETFMARWAPDYTTYERIWRSKNPISYMEEDVLRDRKKFPDIFAIENKQAPSADFEKRVLALKGQSTPPTPPKIVARQSKDTGRPRVVYALPAVRIYGGIISVLQVVNQLILNGIDARICTWGKIEEDALKLFPMYFSPLQFSSQAEMVSNFPDCDLVVATSWDSVYPIYILQQERPHLRSCYFVQDYEPDFYSTSHVDLQKAAERTYHMIADKIVKTRWLQGKLRHFPGRVHRIPLGLNLDYFYNRNVRKNHQILALGRPDSKHRNFAMVQKVYEKISKLRPNTILALYGFGYDAKSLPFPCRDYGLLTSMERVAGAMNESTILLDCSTFQGFGRPGLEAMACGTFPILTRNGGITQYAKHDYNCLLIDPNDENSIIATILRYLDNPSDYADHLRNGRQTADDYSLEIEGRRTAQLFLDLLDQGA
ncbi:MAG: glycosyltransferase [Hyphomonadaceae bacterium]|nr:glycosyltransferase [Hyphomonadaceae bacterium]